MKFYFYYILLFISIYFELIYSQYSLSISSDEYEALWDLYNSTNGDNWKWYLNGTTWNFNLESDPCIDNWEGIMCDCDSLTSISPSSFPSSTPSFSPSSSPSSYSSSSSFFNINDPSFSSNSIQDDLFDLLENISLENYLDLYKSTPFDFFLPPSLQDEDSMKLILSIKKEFKNEKGILKDKFDKKNLPNFIRNLKLKYRSKLYWNQIASLHHKKFRNYYEKNIDFYFKNNKINNNYAEILCRITRLSLPFHNLTGIVNDSLDNLSFLNTLDLEGNNLAKEFPKQILSINSLKILNLGYNSFEGSLPNELLNTSLKVLNIASNRFEGEIPESFFQLPSLEDFNGQNNLFNFNINSLSLENSSQLVRINFNGNFINGNLSFNITQMTNIYDIQFNYNNLSGIPFLIDLNKDINSPDNYYKIPPSLDRLLLGNNNFYGRLPLIFSLTNLSLTEIDFSSNNFFGQLDKNFLINLSNLTDFNVDFNSLTGTLPEDIMDYIPNINIFHILNNKFTGQVPSSLINDDIRKLYIGNNQFTGSLSLFQYNSNSNLKDLVLGGNKFTGGLENLILPKGLITLDLNSLNLYGTIQEYFTNFDRLKELNLYSNNLNGPITNLPPNLQYLQLFNNKFSGGLDPICNLNIATLIYLSNNNFYGTIPECIGSLNLLHYLDISSLSLSGTLPHNIVNMKHLQILDIYNNKLSGEINIDLDEEQLQNLQSINIGGNNFKGKLPFNIITLPNMETFIASKNCFDTRLDEVICQSNSLSVLYLDGIQTSDDCTTKIFPNTIFDSFYTNNKDSFWDKKIEIPKCIFSIQQLTSLHLGGNNYYGELPKDLSISNSLEELYLAHNHLVGKIPLTIQQKRWRFLDLSNNFFYGSLDNAFNTEVDSTVALKANRLSGTLPAFFSNLKEVKVLEGNMYTCSYFNNNLPKDDPYYSVYSCGSNSVNFSIFLWSTVLFCLIVTFLFIISCGINYRNQNQSDDSNGNMYSDKCTIKVFKLKIYENLIQLYENIEIFSYGREVILTKKIEKKVDEKGSYTAENFIQKQLNVSTYSDEIELDLNEDEKEQKKDLTVSYTSRNVKKYLFSSNMWKASLLFDHIRIYSFYLTVLVLFFFLPMNSILSNFFGMYTNSYTWTISSVYLSGMLPSILLSCSFAVIIFLYFYYLYTMNFYERNPILPKNLVKNFNYGQMLDSGNEQISDSVESGGVMMIDLNQRDSIKDTHLELQIKPIQNPYLEIPNRKYVLRVVIVISIINFFITLIFDILYVSSYKNVSSNYLSLVQLSISVFKLIWNEFLWRSFHIIHTYIFFFESWYKGESSFSNPPPLPDKLLYFNLHPKEILALSINSVINVVTIPFLAIAVSSSACFYNGFFAPSPTASIKEVCNITLQVFNFYKCISQTKIETGLSYSNGFVYRYECSSNFMAYYTSVYISMFITSGLILPSVQIFLKHLYNTLISKQRELKAKNMKIPKVYRKLTYFIFSILPFSLLNPTPFPTPYKTFLKHKFLVDLNINVVILFTFSVIYPPLAFIVCVQIWVNTLIEQYHIGNLLKKAYEKQYYWYYYRLHDEFAEIWTLWKECVVLWVPAVLGATFGFVIFDIIGDKYGWKVALAPLIIFLITPLLLKYVALNTMNFLTIFPSRKTDSIINLNVISPLQDIKEDKYDEKFKFNNLWIIKFLSKLINYFNK